MLKQPQEKPRAVWQMAVALYAATSGKFNEVSVDKISSAEEQLLRFMESSKAELVKEIEQKPVLSDEMAKKLGRGDRGFF